MIRFPRVFQTGPVIHVLPSTPPGWCICLPHGKFWEEGDDWEDYYGDACEECSTAGSEAVAEWFVGGPA